MNSLRLQNVKKRFGGVSAVKGLSLDFAQGKIAALIGPNGAGKTTVFNLITGLLHPTEGDIYFNEERITRLSPWRIARLGVGRLFQEVRVFDRLTARENILVAFRDQEGESALRSVFKWRQVRMSERLLSRRAVLSLETVGLAREADRLASDLSFGQQKLLALARLLAADMNVLLLDEPTAGVDPEMVGQILKLIRRIAEEGKTVVIIEHDLDVVIFSGYVDQVFVMGNGQVLSAGRPDIALEAEAVRRLI